MRLSVKIKQQERSDCGAASFASVAAHYGVSIPLTNIRLVSGTDSGGTSIKGLLEAAQHFGFKAEGYKGEEKSLHIIPLPAILHLRKSDGYLHFVVLTKRSPGYFHIMDPAEGDIIKVGVRELLSEWTGYLILISNSDIKRESREYYSILSRFSSLIYKRRYDMLKSLLLSCLHIIASLSVALFIKHLLDDIIPYGESDYLVKVSLLMAAVICISVLISVIKSGIHIKLSVGADNELIGDYLDHLFKIPLPLFGIMKTGEITSRINDAYKIRNLITETIPDTLIASVTLVLSLIILLITDIRLSLICAASIPLFAAIYYISDRVNKPLMRSAMERAARFQSSVIDSIKSIATIKNFGNEQIAFARTKIRLEDLNRTLIKAGRTSVYTGAAAELTSKLMTLAVLWSGGAAVISGVITPGELVSFYAISALFSTPLQQLASSISSFREGSVAASRLYDIMAVEREEECENSLTPVIQNLRLNNVSFGYPGRGLLFENLSFSLESGKILLLKGKSGCGKSTVASLIMKHLMPVSGEITANGKSLADIEAKNWRRSVSIVPQNPDLYGNTIYESIMDGADSEFSQGNNQESIESEKSRLSEQFKELCRELDLDRIFDSLPNGPATHPGEGGALLSRGEQQRIAFARAVIRGPSLLILDEATSSLDSHSANIIDKIVVKLREKGVAILIISHKESDLQIADKVIELK
jgi:ATP-binding cassette subfamily B protein